MDERLENAYNFSNYKLTLASEIKTLKLKLKDQLIHSDKGGTFHISMELITNMVSLETIGKTSNVILLDINENPILIEDIKIFRETISEKYFSALNEYYTNITEMRKKRSVKAIVGEVNEGV